MNVGMDDGIMEIVDLYSSGSECNDSKMREVVGHRKPEARKIAVCLQKLGSSKRRVMAGIGKGLLCKLSFM